MSAEALTIVTCRRCDGSGRYSWNPRDGDRCYGCGGSGSQAVDLDAEARAAERRAKAAAKREAGRIARYEAAEAERDRLVGELAAAHPAEGARLLAGLAADEMRCHEIRVMLSPFGGAAFTVDEAAERIGRWAA